MKDKAAISAAITAVQQQCKALQIPGDMFAIRDHRQTEYDRINAHAGLYHAWAILKDKPGLLAAVKKLMNLI